MPVSAYIKSAQSGAAFSLQTVVTVVVPVVLRLRGEPVAVAYSGRWAVALILEPVPNVSAGRAIARTGRLDAFWLKDNG